MMNFTRGLAFTTILSSLVLGIAPATFSQSVEIGVGAAYNTYTKEIAPVVTGKYNVTKNVYVQPYVKFGKIDTTFGGDLNYRFTNYSTVTPVAGLGVENGNRNGYTKFGLQWETPVILDVDVKIPFNSIYSPEIQLVASYTF